MLNAYMPQGPFAQCSIPKAYHYTPRGFPHFPLIIISVGALSVIDTLILTLKGDNVRRKGNLVFAVRPKQGVAYLRRCFSGNDWISQRRGTWDLRYYLFESLFIWDRGRVPRSVRNAARVGLRINVILQIYCVRKHILL